MILASTGTDRHPDLIDQMFRLRAKVFADRLGWNVTVVDGKEIDPFDAADPLYLLCVDATRQNLKGAVRLLPTTGPHMLRDVFPVLVPNGVIESPTVWESSRFVVGSTEGGPRRSGAQVSIVTIELLCGLIEAAQRAAVEQIVSVFDDRMARAFRALDCPFQAIGTPTLIGKTMTYAGVFDVSHALRHQLGRRGGFDEAVVHSE